MIDRETMARHETAFRAGYAASKRSTTFDLDAAEARFESRHGSDTGTAFAAGWTAYAVGDGTPVAEGFDVYLSGVIRADQIATVRELYGQDAAALVADGWTVDSAINHTVGACDVALCTHPSHADADADGVRSDTGFRPMTAEAHTRAVAEAVAVADTTTADTCPVTGNSPRPCGRPTTQTIRSRFDGRLIRTCGRHGFTADMIVSHDPDVCPTHGNRVAPGTTCHYCRVWGTPNGACPRHGCQLVPGVDPADGAAVMVCPECEPDAPGSTVAADHDTRTVCDCCLLMIANGDASACRDYYGHDHPSCQLAHAVPGDSSDTVTVWRPWSCDGCGRELLPGADAHTVIVFPADD